MKKLQRMVEGAIVHCADQVENLLDATRAEAERQAAARFAVQQKAGAAFQDELMNALAVLGGAARGAAPRPDELVGGGHRCSHHAAAR